MNQNSSVKSEATGGTQKHRDEERDAQLLPAPVGVFKLKWPATLAAALLVALRRQTKRHQHLPSASLLTRVAVSPHCPMIHLQPAGTAAPLFLLPPEVPSGSNNGFACLGLVPLQQPHHLAGEPGVLAFNSALSHLTLGPAYLDLQQAPAPALGATSKTT